MQELVSVIVPVYNIEKYLEFCINSIQNQSYSNIEIILVDDGSTDKSGSICDNLAVKDKRIRVVHQKNGGAAAARNTGLDTASGAYISIIDGDDYILPDMITCLYGMIKETGAQFACCTYELVEKHEINKEDIEPRWKDNSIYNIQKYSRKEIYKKLFDYHTMWVIQPNKLYKRELLESYRFPQGHFYEDEYAAHHLLKNVRDGAFIQYPFYRYYMRAGSATRRGITSRQLYLLDALIDRIQYFVQESETEMLSDAEGCLFEAYRSVAVGMTDRNQETKKELLRIRKEYVKVLKVIKKYLSLSKASYIKRYLFIWMPRVTNVMISIKNS